MARGTSNTVNQLARGTLLMERARAKVRMRSLAQDALSYELETDGTPPTGPEQTAALSSVLARRLSDIDHALHRLDDGTYGVCARCRNTIPPRRLKVQPCAILCVHCQSEAERGGHKRF